MKLTIEKWGVVEGKEVWLFELSHDEYSMTLTNFGAAICSIRMPGQTGEVRNIVLGYDTLEDYLHDPYYTGATVGRYAGRIAGAAFRINGHDYALTANGGSGIHLHGGQRGLNKRVFDLEHESCEPTAATVSLCYESPDGEEGYPGNLVLRIRFELRADRSVRIFYDATCDQDTHLNLTNHTYFNLSGMQQPVLDHELTIAASAWLPATPQFIPTGEVRPAENAPCDFRLPHTVIPGLNETFLLAPDATSAVLHHPASRRTLTIQTSLPAVLVYTGDYLGAPFTPNQGLCLETQFPPDAPNHPQFPSTLLKAHQHWQHHTTWMFSLEGL